MIYNMHGQISFSAIDLIKGYYQIAMDKDSAEKTAFSTPFAQCKYLTMPFGVKNGPVIFQRGMMMVLTGLPWTEVMVYLDDIIGFGKTFEGHLEILDKVLTALEMYRYKLKLRKLTLCREEVDFLRHQISNTGIIPLEKNLSGVINFPVPTTVKQLHQFISMVNFYRRHISNCSIIAKSLSSQMGEKQLLGLLSVNQPSKT